MYFVPIEDPSKAVKVSRLAESHLARITGIAPDTEYMYNKIEIRTQFAGSSALLRKAPRVITSSFTLEAV